MTVYVDIEAPIKFIVLKLKNNSNRDRRISATGYIEWVLGDLRAKSLMHVITEMDADSGTILTSNAYNTEFEGRVAFFDIDDVSKTFTTDRTEFIGRNGTMGNPDGMNRAKLSGKLGAALDPCTVLQTAFDLPEQSEREIIFRLGAGINMSEALNTVNKFKGRNAAKEAFFKHCTN
jgi:cyclic beta-1,2-glucan synthetase